MGVNESVIEKSGAWFNYGSIRMGQGREQARQFLKDNKDAAKEIREKILAKKAPPVEGDKAAVDKADAKAPAKPEKEKAKAGK